MTDRPIIFSAPMVRAIMDGRKTQTRRILKPQPPEWVSRMYHEGLNGWIGTGDGHGTLMHIPYAAGDRLWVREGWVLDSWDDDAPTYRADGEFIYENVKSGWKSPIFMPRKVSRLTLTVTDVRVQRLAEITLGDCWAEGCRTGRDFLGAGAIPKGAELPFKEFRDLWDSMNAKRGFGWDANPWVAAISFEVRKANIDAP